MPQCTWGCTCFLEIVILFSSGIFPEVELFDHMGVPFLILWGTSYCFPYRLHQFTFPSALNKGSLFSTSCQYSLTLSFLTISTPPRMRPCVPVVLICIPLTVSGVDPLFINLLATWISSLDRCLFRFFAHFLIGFFYSLAVTWGSAITSHQVRSQQWGAACWIPDWVGL